MKYFDCPTQVKFYDAENDTWLGGIARHDEIICGCCGGILSVEEVEEEARSAGLESGIQELFWIPISEEIVGDS